MENVHNEKLDNLLEELSTELSKMEVANEYHETDKMTWLINMIGDQLLIAGVTKSQK